MAIRRRLTEAQQLVCRKDPAIIQLGSKAVKGYCQTLDIEKLGKYKEVDEPISVFTALPLQVKYEQYIGYEVNHWMIFRAHVKSITHIDFELDFKDGLIEDKHRADFHPEDVMDIADQIISLANRDSNSVFFSPPVGYVEFIRNCHLLLASQAEADVSLVAAKVKNSKAGKIRKKTE